MSKKRQTNNHTHTHINTNTHAERDREKVRKRKKVERERTAKKYILCPSPLFCVNFYKFLVRQVAFEIIDKPNRMNKLDGQILDRPYIQSNLQQGVCRKVRGAYTCPWGPNKILFGSFSWTLGVTIYQNIGVWYTLPLTLR